MAVDAARGDDAPFARDHFGARPDNDADAGLHIGIARLADDGDAPVPEADIGLDDAPMVEDERIGDDGIDSALGAGDLALAHAVADHLAAAELHFLAINGAVLLHLDDEVGVGKPHAVAHGGAIDSGIGGAGDAKAHGASFPLMRPWKP